MRVAIIGATYTGNRGAAAMLVSTVEKLREKLPGDTEFHVLSLYREKPGTALERGVRIVSLPAVKLLGVMPVLCLLYRLFSGVGFLRKVLLRYSPLETVAGADVYLDLSGISFVDGRGITLLYNICCLLPGLLLGVPVFKMSQAMGPFQGKLNRWAALRLLPRVRRIYSRGPVTTEHLSNLGLCNLVEAADLAFLLGEGQDIPSAEESQEKPALTIGIAPSQVLMNHSNKTGVDYIGALNRAVAPFASREDCRILVIAHSNLGDSVRSRNNDYHVCTELFNRLDCNDKQLIIDDLGPEDLRGIISRCDVFIASRFHSMISALCESVPVLVTSWSHKYREVMDQFDCGEWVLGSSELAGPCFGEKLALLVERREGVRGLIEKNLNRVIDSAGKQIDGVAAFLLGGVFPSSTRMAHRLYDKFYNGCFSRCIMGHTLDDDLRRVCASGGQVTTLLSERLSRGHSSGAIVAGVRSGDDGSLHPGTFLAVSHEELQDLAGSVYSDFDHVGGVLRILEASDQLYDIVGLPCQLSRLRKTLEKRPELLPRVGLLVGLWCGHITDQSLLQTLLGKWNIPRGSVSRFRYRTGQWRGKTRITLRDGSVIEKSFSRGYGLYQNMYADSALRCFSCGDHFGQSSDISFGDCWIGSEKGAEHKKTMALSITSKGDEAIQLLLASPLVSSFEVPPVLAVESQKRSVVWHTCSCAARERLQGLFSMRIKCSSSVTPRWNDYLSGFLTLLFYRLYRGRLRGLMFRLPWWALFPIMALQKLALNR